jgi:hypothetical protein
MPPIGAPMRYLHGEHTYAPVPNVQHSAAADGRRLQCIVRHAAVGVHRNVNLAGPEPLGGRPATPPDQREPTTSTLAAIGREPLRPARPAPASAQDARRAEDYNVRQANLDTHRRSDGGQPLRPPGRTRASAQQTREAVTSTCDTSTPMCNAPRPAASPFY